jgi:hypothetical protein
MARQYCVIKDVEKEPYHNTTDFLSEGVTITKPRTTPSVSVSNVAGVFVEPAEQMEKYKYTMRGIKIVDPEGNILFEITMRAAPLEDDAAD